MNICSPCSGDFAFAKCLCMDYKYSFTDDTTCVLGPQKLQCSRDLQECLTNSQKYLGTFQLLIHATKITNFWSKQLRVVQVIDRNTRERISDESVRLVTEIHGKESVMNQFRLVSATEKTITNVSKEFVSSQTGLWMLG